MPVAVVPLVGIALGALFAWAGMEELSRVGGSSGSRALVVSALFGAFVFAPACGYFQAFFPDWSYAYWLDALERPVAIDLALVVVDAVSVPLGLALFARSAASRRTGALARGIAIPSFVAGLALIAMLPRLRIVGTYAEFHGDFGTEPLTGSPVGYALIWMIGIVAAAATWTLQVLRRLSEPST
ncbi:MAG TPA: hypothetical protein VH062_19095 [Polyangiaceae bacterium]|jgi:hypothetical protein|nr:hypothetical protein [Polyangiaceae bacterium]